MFRPLAVSVALGVASVAAIPALAQADPCAGKPPAEFVAGNGLCLAVREFGVEPKPDGTLYVVLHGDVSSGGRAVYHFDLAREIASAFPGAPVVAMIRPGYDDGEGRQSTGSHNGRADHYTAQNVDAAAEAIPGIPPATKIVVAVGVSDTNTWPRISQDYVQRLTTRGIAARYAEIPGVGHNMDRTMRAAAVGYLKEMGR